MDLDINNITNNSTSSSGNNSNIERQSRKQQQQMVLGKNNHYNHQRQQQATMNNFSTDSNRASGRAGTSTRTTTDLSPSPPVDTIVVTSPTGSEESDSTLMIQTNSIYTNDSDNDKNKNYSTKYDEEGENDNDMIDNVSTGSQNSKVLDMQQQQQQHHHRNVEKKKTMTKTTMNRSYGRSILREEGQSRYRSVSPLKDYDDDDDDDDNNIDVLVSSSSPQRKRISQNRSIKSLRNYSDDDEQENNNDGIFHGDNSFRNFSTSSIRDAIRELRTAVNEQRTDNNISTTRNYSNTSTNTSTKSIIWYCCKLVYHTFYTIILVLLIVFVLYLSYQLRTVQNQIQNDEESIAILQKQIITQQHTQDNLNEKVVQEHSYTMYQIAGTFTLLTCLITLFHITQHISYWHEPVIQSKIITILWMSPIYSITSWLSLVFPLSLSGYLSVIKDFYEAYVIYTFLSFLIAVLGRGDRDVAIRVLSYNSHHLHTPTSLFTSCYHPPPQINDLAKAGAILLECQIWTMQFVLLRPFTSVTRFILEQHNSNQQNSLTDPSLSNRYLLDNDTADTDTDSGSTNHYIEYIQSSRFIIDMITNVSVFLAFHGLLKFYHAVHHNLQWCKPFSKFLTIKGIVFLTFWQGLVISILCNIDKSQHTTTGTNHSSNNHYHYNQQQQEPTISSNDNLQHRFLRYIVATVVNATASNYTDNGQSVNGFDTTSIMTNYTDIVSNYTDPMNEFQGNTSFANGTYPPSYMNTDDNTINDDDDNAFTFSSNDPNEESARIQNFLICLEMLFFSLAHWCVYSAEEWKPDYRPPDKPYAKPGIGLKDFASDIGYIVNSSTSARAYNKQQRQQRKRQLQQQQDYEQNKLNSTQSAITVVNNDVGSDEDDDTSIASNMTSDIIKQTIENNDGTISTMKSTTATIATPTATDTSINHQRRRFFGGWATGRRRARYENIQQSHQQQQQQQQDIIINSSTQSSLTIPQNSTSIHEQKLHPVLEPDSSFVIDDGEDDNYNNDHDGVELCDYIINNEHDNSRNKTHYNKISTNQDNNRYNGDVIQNAIPTVSSFSSYDDDNSIRKVTEDYTTQII